MNSLPRAVVKNFTLRVIYGSSLSTLKEVVDSWPDEKVRQAQRDIKIFFGISSIASKLKRKIKKTGIIENIYGRSISPTTDASHVLFNNYIQSSASDAALLGFKSLYEKIKSEKIKANLIFIIHDAIILDVHPDSFQKLKSISEDGISVLNSEIKFPLSFEIIS
jgi:DNA polymerase I-like protein with 3'-5' exonuclease and polymerase domains